MTTAIKAFGLFTIIAGIAILLKSDMIIQWIQNESSNQVLFISAIIGRLIIGTLFILTAGASKYPIVFKIIGGFSILAALIFLIMGHHQFTEFVTNYISKLKSFAPIAGLVSIGFGIFLFYAYSNKAKNVAVEL